MKVKGISIHEPWASLIRTGAKTYETRSWATQYRGPLLICAAKTAELIRIELSYEDFQRGLSPLLKPGFSKVSENDLHFGKAVALVEVTHCIPTSELGRDDIGEEGPFGDFFPGRYAWKLKIINNTFEPFPVKGRQGLFDVELSEGIKL
jgi:hypothetical protein